MYQPKLTLKIPSNLCYTISMQEGAGTHPERLFTQRELYHYDGEDGRVYIAYQGIVYDVSDCPKWRNGLHEQMHFPGQDLTSEFPEAPHAEEVFRHPCVRPIGRLIEG